MYGNFGNSSEEAEEVAHSRRIAQPDIMDILEKIFKRIEQLEFNVFVRMEDLILPLLKAKDEIESKPAVVENLSGGNEVAKVEEIVIPQEPSSKVLDEVLANVVELRTEVKKREEFIDKTDKLLNQLEVQTSSNLSALQKDVDSLEVRGSNVQSILANLTHLFAFVYGKERGKPVQLKGGLKDDKLLVHCFKTG